MGEKANSPTIATDLIEIAIFATEISCPVYPKNNSRKILDFSMDVRAIIGETTDVFMSKGRVQANFLLIIVLAANFSCKLQSVY